MITIIVEKFDNAMLMVGALVGIEVNGKTYNSSGYTKNKDLITKAIKPKGYLEFEYKGQGYYIVWAQGHLLELYSAKDYNEEYKNWKELPIPFIPPKYEFKIKEGVDFKTFKPTGEPSKFAVNQLNHMKRCLNKSTSIINALDDDREGELIYKLIIDYLEVDLPYKKIVLDELTDKGIIRSMDNLKDSKVYDLSAMSAYARSIVDWIVGINLTTTMTLNYAQGLMITVGRVQTPVLNMIVEREEAIRNFKSEPFWNVEAEFNGEFIAKYTNGRFDKKENAEKLLSKIEGKNGVVSSVEVKPVEKKVPLLYDLAELQKFANKKYKIPVNDVLAAVQSLYMAGLVSYPRTDSRYLPDEMTDNIDNVLDMLSGLEEYKEHVLSKGNRNYDKVRHFNSKKVSSHYAIIPTETKPENLRGNEKLIYDLIARSVIKMVYKSATLENTKISVDVEGEEFSATGNVMKDPQWMIIEDMPKDKTLPILNKGDVLSGEYLLKEGETSPPLRYTQGSMVEAMESVKNRFDDEELKKAMDILEDGGLGRPATRGPIVEGVVKRYCVMEKNFIVPKEESIKLINGFSLEDIKSPEMTAKWELRLDEIAHGNETADDFISEMERVVKGWCEYLIINKPDEPIFSKLAQTTSDHNCPNCGSPLRIVKGGYVCTSFDKDSEDSCKFFILGNMWGGKLKLAKSQILKIIKNKRSDLIKGIKKSDGGEYNAYITLREDGSLMPAFNAGSVEGVKCPKCGGVLSETPYGYKCENNRYKDDKSTCDFFISRNVFGKTLTQKELKTLLTKKETGKLSGFVSKNKLDKDGNPATYSAKLILEDGRVRLKFD